MTITEIIVVIGGLLLGYWIVWRLLNRTPASSTNGKSNESHAGSKQGEKAQRETAGSNQSDGNTQQEQAKRESPGNKRSNEDEFIPGSWYRILEVPEGATLEAIVRAYKQKISQYHPDKVENMGAEIRELAEFKSKQINAAYDYAVKLRR
jgi:DnaJ like chaperone protein